MTDNQIQKKNLINAFNTHIQDGFIISRPEALRLNKKYPSLRVGVNNNLNAVIINL